MKTTQNLATGLIDLPAYQAESEVAIRRNLTIVKVALVFFVAVLNVCCFQLFF